MATTSASLPLPRTRARKGGRRWRWVVLILVLIVLAGAGAYLYLRSQAPRTTRTASSTYTVARGSIMATVSGSGSVATSSSESLSFKAGGTVTEVLVQLGDTVKAGQVLARLDEGALKMQVTPAEANLASAQAALDDLKAGPTAAELSAAKLSVVNAKLQLQNLTSGSSTADVASARSSLLTAQQNLATLQSGDPTEIQHARDALEQAKNSLAAQQISRDSTCGKPKMETQCDAANITVGNGEIAVRQAQATLDELLAGPTDTELKVAQLAVTQANGRLASLSGATSALELEAAQLQLENAQAKLDELNAGASAADLAKAQASVESAKVALSEAQDALDGALLQAPFDGTVTAVNVTAGDDASAGTAAVSLVGRSELHVDLKLSENDAVAVQAGQPVTLTFDSLEGKALAGTVSYVSPAAESTNGVVTYAVRVKVAQDDPQVRIGMSANVSIITARKENVLLVPNTALLPQDSGGYMVMLVSRGGAAPGQGFPGANGTPGAGRGQGQGFPGANGTPGAGRGQGFPGANGTSNAGARATRQAQMAQQGGQFPTPVKTGLSDGTYTEIVEGLREGDVVEALATTGISGSNGGFRGGPGGFGIMGGIFGGR